MKGWKKISHENENQKKAQVVCISDKRDFKTKAVIKDKEECYVIIKESIQIESITSVNIYALAR